ALFARLLAPPPAVQRDPRCSPGEYPQPIFLSDADGANADGHRSWALRRVRQGSPRFDGRTGGYVIMPGDFFATDYLPLMDSPLDFFISTAAAQGTAPSSPGAGIGTLLLPVMLIVVFYFLLIRPQQKKQKEHTAMVSTLAVGSEIVTGGGVLGKVTEVGEQFVTVEIADGVNIKVQRHSIGAVLPKDTIKHAWRASDRT